LEVLETTGESISTLQAKTKPALAPERWRGVVLTPEREALYASIDARFEKMLAADVLDEVRAFSARNLDPALPATKAHGAPALMAHLRGELSLAQAAEIAKRDTRRYAKRQFTWIANQMPQWPRIAPVDVETRVTQTLAAAGLPS
jgi:tRNA dimethylallyltransferase